MSAALAASDSGSSNDGSSNKENKGDNVSPHVGLSIFSAGEKQDGGASQEAAAASTLTC